LMAARPRLMAARPRLMAARPRLMAARQPLMAARQRSRTARQPKPAGPVRRQPVQLRSAHWSQVQRRARRPRPGQLRLTRRPAMTPGSRHWFRLSHASRAGFSPPWVRRLRPHRPLLHPSPRIRLTPRRRRSNPARRNLQDRPGQCGRPWSPETQPRTPARSSTVSQLRWPQRPLSQQKQGRPGNR